MKLDKVYVGEANWTPEVTQNEHLADSIELVDITLREEVVYDVDLTIPMKVVMAQMLDALNVPIIQLHTRGAKEVVDACRAAGVKARFEVLCRPYNPYGFDDWKGEVGSAAKSGADLVHPSITTPRKWAMGEAGVTPKDVAQHALDAVKYAFDQGAPKLTLGFTDVPRTDLNWLVDTSAEAVKLGATTVLLNDTVGVAKPELMRKIVKAIATTGAKVRVHCHNDFGLATANTLASLEAGAGGAEVIINGADPARSGIAPLAEVVMALLCLYRKDIGVVTEKLTEASFMFADMTGIPVAEQKPVVAARNWMYKRDHIMRTITKDESIQFPFSPSLVGSKLAVGMGRGVGPVGVKIKLDEMGLRVADERIDGLVDRITSEAMSRKRRLTDDEFRSLVKAYA
jgi:D-citramalate synthase